MENIYTTNETKHKQTPKGNKQNGHNDTLTSKGKESTEREQ